MMKKNANQLDRYNIVRFYHPHVKKPNRIVKKNVSLEDAQAHCSDPKTRNPKLYFDGYEKVGK
jgi:hypothetical protein